MNSSLFITGLVSLIALSSCATKPRHVPRVGPHHTTYGSSFAYPDNQVGDAPMDPAATPPQDNFNEASQNTPHQPVDQSVSPSGTQQAPPRTAPPASNGNYPVAERTSNPSEVKSPYEPFELIDVSGYKSGQLVRHPTTKKIFRVP